MTVGRKQANNKAGLLFQQPSHSFYGPMVALVTPLKKGKIDETALRDLVDWQIAEGTHVLVPCGTTGEASCLSYDENEAVIKMVVEQAAGRVPVLAGAGANATANAINLTQRAQKAGAQGTLQVVPYYNKPTQEGLYQHFKAIAAAADLPMILYNIPGRTALNMVAETTIRLSTINNIVGIKECSGDFAQVKQIRNSVSDDFVILSGDDAANIEMYEAGAQGSISVAANIIPKKVATIWNLFHSGKRQEALELHEAIQPLNRGIFMETNPIPIKTALAIMGKCTEEFRLPLVPMYPANRAKLEALLKEYRLCPN